MARKMAAMLRSKSVALSPRMKEQMDNLNARSYDEDAKDEWADYLRAVAKELQEWARLGAMQEALDAKPNDTKLREAYAKVGRNYDSLVRQSMSYLDRYMHKIAHKDDKIKAMEEDVLSVTVASLSDKLDELQFTLNYGLLGSKVAQAIRQSVSEESLDVPYCSDHA